MRIFVAVVQNGSLSSAGRQLGLSPASVSRHIGALEESLGCRLVNRTSRKLTLTEPGELYTGLQSSFAPGSSSGPVRAAV